jgi:glycosyltransferase involved in cell wall biosynthesis
MISNKNNLPLVSIICTTFNQENFIKQALDSFLMQQTKFPFEIIVHDDASTDNTQSFVREYQLKYPELFNNIYQTENQFSKKELNIWIDITFPRARGKYIALCEGDDYWTDPHKLQKQVDFLEMNGKYCISWSAFDRKENGKLLESISTDTDKVDINTFSAMKCMTLTCLFRRSAIVNLNHSKFKHFKDIVLFFYILKQGSGYYLKDNTSVYRMHSGGIWTGASSLNKLITDTDSYIEIFYKIVKTKNLALKIINQIDLINGKTRKLFKINPLIKMRYFFILLYMRIFIKFV